MRNEGQYQYAVAGVVVAVTGCSGDVGFDACRQLCGVAEVSKVVITCRTADKCAAVVAKLVKATGKDSSFFSYVVLDLSDLSSIMAAVAAFPSVDRLCLNAGGMTTNNTHAKTGATTQVVSNVLGHSILTDELIKREKINPGGRIVYIGTEITRTVWAFTGFFPLGYWSFTADDLDWAISKHYDGLCSCLPLKVQLGDYKNAKIVGQLYYAGIAKERPDIHTMTTSPGAVGGTFIDGALFPLYLFKPLVPCLFRCLCVSQPIPVGAKRYVDVLTGPPTWEPGAMAMTGYAGCCCLWGMAGSMTDNRAYATYLRDDDLAKKTVQKVREYQDKWFRAESMQR
jgi:NAD(P)-dependent dehydrogenase (short-subunit alcohol dehydrogenase family)